MRVVVAGHGRPYLYGDSLDHQAPLVFTIDEVLSADECAQQIALVEELGPTVAPITTADGPMMRTDIRNNTRVMRDDLALARLLFERVAPQLPQRLCDMRPVGANERFRYYKYTP